MLCDALTHLRRLVHEEDTPSSPCPGAAGCSNPIPSARMLTDDELTAFLDEAEGDVRLAAYRVLLHKSRCTQVTLGGGISLPDESAYWLRLASLYRPNSGGYLTRADEEACP